MWMWNEWKMSKRTNERTSEQSINHRAILNSIFQMHDIVIMDQINLRTHTHISKLFIEAPHDFPSKWNKISSVFHYHPYAHWNEICLKKESNRMSLWMRCDLETYKCVCIYRKPLFLKQKFMSVFCFFRIEFQVFLCFPRCPSIKISTLRFHLPFSSQKIISIHVSFLFFSIR